MENLRVGGGSKPTGVAGAISAVIRTDRQVQIQAIGAQAVNQAVKAIAIARNYLEEDGLDISCQPSFLKLMLRDEERTAILFTITVAEDSSM